MSVETSVTVVSRHALAEVHTELSKYAEGHDRAADFEIVTPTKFYLSHDSAVMGHVNHGDLAAIRDVIREASRDPAWSTYFRSCAVIFGMDDYDVPPRAYSLSDEGVWTSTAGTAE